MSADFMRLATNLAPSFTAIKRVSSSLVSTSDNTSLSSKKSYQSGFHSSLSGYAYFHADYFVEMDVSKKIKHVNQGGTYTKSVGEPRSL